MAELDWSQIIAICNQRRDLNGDAISEMIQVRERYNADWVIPLPDTDGEPVLPPLTPALIAEAIDNVSMLASSVNPIMTSPPVTQNETGKRGRGYAETRRKILYATWHGSHGGLVRRRAFRHLCGYATATLLVRPDFGLGRPVVEVRDPLGTYPEPKAPEDLSPPEDCAYIFARSATWLREHHPQVAFEHGGPVGAAGDEDDMWDLCEWVDRERCVVGILGPQDVGSQSAQPWVRFTGGTINHSFEIARWSNPTGICPVVTMPRVTLDKIASQISHTVGMVDLMAKIMALALVAEERSVFADRYAVGVRGSTPKIVSNNGQWMDGRTGAINLLEDVDKVGDLSTPASQTSLQMIDRLERNFKVSGTGLVPAMGGETYGALRTGRGIDSMMGAAVDPRVQEIQEIMQYGMAHLNTIILEQWRTYWPEAKVILPTGFTGAGSLVEFEPDKHIEHLHNSVSYPIPGMDAQSTTVTLGQMLGMESISKRTLREKHPWIDDPDTEGRLVDEEALESAMLEGIKQKAAAGELPLKYVAKIQKHRLTSGDIFAAIEKADAEASEEQATAVPAPPPEAGMIAPPEAMPGLEAPPAEALQPAEAPPQIEGPAPSQANLQDLLGALSATA